MAEDVRWQQRFQDFEKVLLLLDKAIDINEPNIFEQAGLIQFLKWVLNFHGTS